MFWSAYTHRYEFREEKNNLDNLDAASRDSKQGLVPEKNWVEMFYEVRV